MEIFTIRNLTFSYPEQAAKVLKNVNINVSRGDFITICGPSGCGKTTLLRQMKTVLSPHGTRTGDILFEGEELSGIDLRRQSSKIGFVLQSPDNQIVTDKVWHELAFGLESLGYDTQTIRRRVAEMADFFGIESWFYKDVTELSGGQKQLLNLASIMVMQPSVLILDEPTSQLDPIAASDFIATIGRINRDLGTTVVMSEHRLEEVLPLSTGVIVLDGGEVRSAGTPEEIGTALRDSGHKMFLAMPAAMRIWAHVPNELPCPVTVREARHWLETYLQDHGVLDIPEMERPPVATENVLTIKEAWFKYEQNSPDVIKGMNLEVKRGEFVAIMGGNGAGKSTALSLVSGRKKPYRGTAAVCGSVGLLPQNPQTIFVKKSVREDLDEILKYKKLPKQEREKSVANVVQLCRLEGLLDRHPFDLSGGEQQRAALAKILLINPDILLLDEPTKGLDAEYKQALAQILQRLIRRGVTVIMVSHDIEFCAKYAHSCAMLFDGNIVAAGAPRTFFSGNSFYTTSANRIARSRIPRAVTAEDVIAACGGEIPPEPRLPEDDAPPLPPPEENSPAGKPSKLPLWRRILAGITAAAAIGAFFSIISVSDLSELLTGEGISGDAPIPQMVVFIVSAMIFAVAIGRRSYKPPDTVQMTPEERRLPKRTVAAAVMILLLVPVTLFVGVYYLANTKYYFIALLIMLEVMLPFVLVFEGRKPQARELVIIAVLCAICIAGRTAFFALPNFKPVTALVIISGIAFGGETGFLVGAVTMLVSNIMFSQGPWTPFQMFAMGLIGFLAGVLFKKGALRRTRSSMCAFGAVATVVVYGGITNLSAALIWARELNLQIIMTYYLTGFPIDLVHAVATFFFLYIASEPMLEKLDRIKVKYGLI